ncbi:hypothetical protein MCAG_05274 [Micromonospora sp. ATCC 39149]|uniref:RICIN domain-containing protein n=1 Tax=Micromonospora sp. (strain ATCC 39149 / NRRL 15099 / SCC 1413) TaxID=219305 RepID=UPI0001A50034|nr:RICIN domain-containing protein [Micromonospora sp. ATCC 39149]EEP74947.1 hypothetical protein MCAG_05274 [Micromonospora sp. ATCC 39149]
MNIRGDSLRGANYDRIMFTDAVECFTVGSGGSGPTPGAYRIVNRNSGKPLAVAGGSTTDGAKVVQQSGSATWTIGATQEGSYTLRYVPSGKLLDVNGGDQTPGLQLQQWSANGGTNQICVPALVRGRLLHHRQPRQRPRR